MLRKVVFYLSGQGLVLLINIFVGVLFIHWLPKDAYGFYILGTTIQAVVCAFSDFGLTNAVNTLIARDIDDLERNSSIFKATWKLRKEYLPLAITSGIVLSYFIIDFNIAGISWLIITSLVGGLLQSALNISKSFLNASRNASGLFTIGLSECFTRLILVPICLMIPEAATAMTVNVVGMLIALVLINKWLPNGGVSLTDELSRRTEIKNFVNPLIPSVIYSVLQAQLGITILGFLGSTLLVAETGALGRIGQIVGLLFILNPFWVQPHFAQIQNINTLRKDVAFVLFVLAVLAALLIISSHSFPRIWLWLLGEKYQSSSLDLPWAVLSAIVYGTHSVLYTIVMARSATRWQSLTIVLGVGFQFVYLLLFGVTKTQDAILLGMLPGLGGVIVQIIILVSLLNKPRIIS